MAALQAGLVAGGEGFVSGARRHRRLRVGVDLGGRSLAGVDAGAVADRRVGRGAGRGGADRLVAEGRAGVVFHFDQLLERHVQVARAGEELVDQHQDAEGAVVQLVELGAADGVLDLLAVDVDGDAGDELAADRFLGGDADVAHLLGHLGDDGGEALLAGVEGGGVLDGLEHGVAHGLLLGGATDGGGVAGAQRGAALADDRIVGGGGVGAGGERECTHGHANGFFQYVMHSLSLLGRAEAK